MAVLFPSDEWCQKWQNAINSNAAAKETGKDWGADFNGNWLFEITPGSGLEQTAYLYLEANAGECTDARLIHSPSEAEVGFMCTGSYEDYKAAVKGEKDLIQGVVRGTFKLKGDMMKLMKHGLFVRAVVNSLQSIDSEFLDG